MSSAATALPLKPDAAPALPAEAASDVAFGGFGFAGGPPPAGPGVLAVALPLDGRLYPLLIEAADDLAKAAAAARAIAKAASMSRCFQAGLCPVAGSD